VLDKVGLRRLVHVVGTVPALDRDLLDCAVFVQRPPTQMGQLWSGLQLGRAAHPWNRICEWTPETGVREFLKACGDRGVVQAGASRRFGEGSGVHRG
jgi:hypothetical protein